MKKRFLETRDYMILISLSVLINLFHYAISIYYNNSMLPAIFNSLAYGYDPLIVYPGWLVRWAIIRFGPYVCLFLGVMLEY